jgi:hypothetical protein
MRRLMLVLMWTLLWAAPSEAAWALIGGAQTQQAEANDPVITFGVAPSASNKVLVAAAMTNEAQTMSFGATWAGTISTTIGPIDSAGFTLRAYIWCLTPDGADTSFTITTSGTAVAHVYAAEFSGGSCTQDGSTSSNDITGASPGTEEYVLTTDITTTNAASMLFGIIISTTSANFAPGTNMTQLGTDTTQTVSEYRILSATGTYDTPYSAAVNESAMLLSVAFQPAASVGNPARLLLLRVGGN